MSETRLKKVDLIFKDECFSQNQLAKTLKKSKEEILKEILDSGLRGRGGAGFPTGLKWKFASEQPGERYVICNADEGEPGTFKDREILDKVACKVLNGMALCGKVIDAKEGFIYLRGEYRFLVEKMNQEIEKFHKTMEKIGFEFKINIVLGSGAYICGEESALFESMEGKRGEPRNKPPYPTIAGFRNCPTVINNVETFVSALIVNEIGSDEYKKLGTQDSRGSKLFSISGDTPIAGIYELELGMSLDQFVEEFGDGDTKAVQVGGAAGFCVPRKKFNETIIGFEGIPTGGSMMIFNSSRSMYNVLRNYLEFFVEESCGQCTPCRVGCQQLLIGIKDIKKGEQPVKYLNTLIKLAETMKITSKCGLGQSVANSFASIVQNFKEEMIY